MRVAVVHNQDREGVINVFGIQNREQYSPRTIERVATALERGGHAVRVLDGNLHVVEQLQDFMPRVMAGERPGMVFNMAYGIQGVSRYTHMPAMLEMLGVPYVGSNPQAHGLALDKVVAKMIFDADGLPTPGFWNFASADDRFDDIEYPVIVKPKMEAVSYGIQVVHDEGALRDAVANIIDQFGQHVLVESFIPGREFAVGLLGNAPPDVLPIVEIDLEGDADAIQTADDKLGRPKDKLCPAPIDDALAYHLRDLSRRAFASLGLADFARVDFRVDADDNPYILEINSMASLGTTGSYARGAQEAGLDFDALVNRMLDVAAARYFGADPPGGDAPAAPTSSPTARLRSQIRGQAVTIESQLDQAVSMRSPADSPDGVNRFGEWVSRRFRDLGFEAEVDIRAETGNALVLTNHDGDEHDVVFVGHLDTATGAPFRRLTVAGRRILGTGVAEAKGGIVVLLAALRGLRHLRRLRKLRLAVVLTPDDTIGGPDNAALISDVTGRARHVLGLKAASSEGAVTTSRAGRATFHVSARWDDAVDPDEAVAQFTRKVLGARRAASDDVRVAVTHLLVDAGFDHAPTQARATVTVRMNREPADAVVAEVRRLLSTRKGGLRMDVRGGLRRPPLPRREVCTELAQRIQHLGADLHVPTAVEHRWGSSDLCSVAPEVAFLDGLGPAGGDERTGEEWIWRSSLVDRSVLLAALLLELQG